MRRWIALLLALVLLLGLAACGNNPDNDKKTEPEEELTRGGIPEDQTAPEEDPVEEPDQVDWDLSICQPEEVYREIEHYNIDPTGYRGMSLRVAGEYFSVEDHGKVFYYIGVRDEDGCVETLELRFPGNGKPPANFPKEHETVTVWGVLDYYSAEKDGKVIDSAVLREARLSRFVWDGRD